MTTFTVSPESWSGAAIAAAWVHHDDHFDLARINLQSGDVDYVLLSVDDAHEAAVVDLRDA